MGWFFPLSWRSRTGGSFLVLGFFFSWVWMRRSLGKIVGLFLGFALGGPAGAFVGFIIGMLRDNQPTPLQRETTRRRSHTQGRDSLQHSTYLIGVVVLAAKLSKVDGRVTRREIDVFRRVFRISDADVSKIGPLFDQARTSSSGYEPYAARLAHVFRDNPAVLEDILAGLLHVAVADAPKLSQPEDRFLRRVAQIFGFGVYDFARIAARVGVTLSDEPARPEKKRDDSFAVLGLPETATAEEVKKTYRALIRKHHPDKLAAQGLSGDALAKATEKMKRLNVAYDTICKERGMR